ncbi:MAG: hypothetical protein QXW73_01220 [Nitrososphaerales archaeon]
MPPPIDLSGKNVTVFVKMNPASLTANAPEDATLGIRFFDVNTDQNLQQVTYRVWVKKSNNLLMNEWFYDPNGDLSIKIRPTDTKQVRVYGEQEPQLGGWYGRGSPAVVEAPIFLEGGLYNIFVEIFSVNTTKQILDPPLEFDAWVSVAEDNSFMIVDDGKEYPITIRTYFDTIDQFRFEESNKVLTFSMPFNWEPEFTRYVYVVHEEIIVPKEFESFVRSGNFEATVNGVQIGGRALLVDPYSFEDKLVIHFLLSQQELQKIGEEIIMDGTYPHEMLFELRPVEGKQLVEGTSMNLVTDNGRVRMLLAWDKEFIEPDTPVRFDITFFDSTTNMILRDVHYSIKIFDDSGNEIFSRDNLLSNEGIDTHEYMFARTGIATVQVHVMGTGPFAFQMDTSFMGTAEGTIHVVPEFPIGTFIVITGAFAAALLITRRSLNTVFKIKY